MANTDFQTFLNEEVNKVKGIYYPVKAGFLRRMLTKTAAIEKIHPNPGDEFCFPEIGPNYEIISGYVRDYNSLKGDLSARQYLKSGAAEPLMVEKTKPEGYMLLNGHHRWAAARRVGLEKVPIKIVDLTLEKDIRKMIGNASSDMRVTLDLDEVVFRPENDPYLEKPLLFPLNRIYRERIRLGVPALFNFLNSRRCDIWVYTARYCSLDDLKRLFRHYHMRVTGIVTGTARKINAGSKTGKEVEKMITACYRKTLHIDNELVLCTNRDTRAFEEHRLSGSAADWSREVMEIIGEMKQNEKKA